MARRAAMKFALPWTYACGRAIIVGHSIDRLDTRRHTAAGAARHRSPPRDRPPLRPGGTVADPRDRRPGALAPRRTGFDDSRDRPFRLPAPSQGHSRDLP